MRDACFAIPTLGKKPSRSRDRCIAEAVRRSPQAKGRVRYVVHFLAVAEPIPAVAELGRMIPLHHRAKVAIAEADAFDVGLREMARTVGDRETPLRRAVNEMSGSGQ